MRNKKLVIGLAAAVVIIGCGGGGGNSSDSIQTSGGGSTSGVTSVTQGLIHWWRFDGNANDSVGTLNGTVVGPMTYQNAVLGEGISGNGRTTGVNVPIVPDMQFQASFSISAWVLLRSYTTTAIWSAILFYGDDRFGLDPYEFNVDPKGNLTFVITGGSGSGELATPLPLNKFQLVTGTYDKPSGVMSLYVNGVLQKTLVDDKLTPVIGLDPNANPGIGIGINNDFPISFNDFGWNGIIDDLRIYNRALSATEVKTIFNEPVTKI